MSETSPRKAPKKWILISAILAALWLLLTLLAENQGARESLAKLNEGWIKSIESVQLHEHFAEFLGMPDRIDPDNPQKGINPLFRPVRALYFTAEKALEGGIVPTLLFVLACVGGYLSYRGLKDETRESGNWILPALMVPLVAAILLFLLKVVVIWILGLFGFLIQIIGSLAIGILAIDKLISMFDLISGSRNIAEKVGKSMKK